MIVQAPYDFIKRLYIEFELIAPFNFKTDDGGYYYFVRVIIFYDLIYYNNN